MIIEIPGQTRAKKNSVRVIKLGKRNSIMASAIYKKWEKIALKHLADVYPNAKWQGGYPLEVCFFLCRENRRKWDIDNVFCGCLDVLQQVGILEDDSANHVIPVFSGWTIDNINPRVILKLRPTTKTYYRQDLEVLK